LAENPWKRVVAWQDNEKQPISTAKNIWSSARPTQFGQESFLSSFGIWCSHHQMNLYLRCNLITLVIASLIRVCLVSLGRIQDFLRALPRGWWILLANWIRHPIECSCQWATQTTKLAIHRALFHQRNKASYGWSTSYRVIDFLLILHCCKQLLCRAQNQDPPLQIIGKLSPEGFFFCSDQSWTIFIVQYSCKRKDIYSSVIIVSLGAALLQCFVFC
jgi:hypothetical protein